MILILGAKGQLGTEFRELFDRLGLEYLATDKNEIDVTKKEFVNKYILDTHKFKNIDTIINCTGYEDIDKAEEEQEECFKINMEAAVNLALIAKEIGAIYLTFSSDMLFSGRMDDYLYNNSVGFSEEDEARPLSNYAQSKYEAEILITQSQEMIENLVKFYIIRTSWMFGKGSDNFIEKIIKAANTNKEIFVVDDQVSSPTYAKDLAEFSWKLLVKNANSGIYHFTNDGIVSKYDYAKYILEKISWKGNLIPIKTNEISQIAKRPQFSKLNCKKIKEVLAENIPHWTDAVDRYFRENNL